MLMRWITLIFECWWILLHNDRKSWHWQIKASLVAQLVKNLPAVWETWVRYLGWEDPLEKGKATHSSILAWRIPWTVHEVVKSRTRLSDFHFHYECSVNCISLLVFYFFFQLYLIVVVYLSTLTWNSSIYFYLLWRSTIRCINVYDF